MPASRSGEWTRRTASAALAVLAAVAPVRAAGPATSPSATSTTTAAAAKTPSSDRLPHGSIGTSAGTTPFAWVDDASLLGPGRTALTLSAVGWLGTRAHELEAPVVGAAVGVVPRLQLSVHAPYVIGDQKGGVAGGWGTTYLSGKIGVLQGDSLKLSVAPTLQLLDPSVLTSTAISGRAQWGVPLSAEIDRGSAHVFASAGYFSGGIGFAGGGVSVDVSPRVMMSGSLSHAWTGATTTNPAATRTDLSGGGSFALTSHFGLFGSIGQTVATTDASGAGTTVVAGVSILAGPSASRP
jgi:hypothetical protein